MDLFNNKKLLEKEEELSRLKLHAQQLETTKHQLKQELSDRTSEVESLHNEKTKEAELHREVTDTILGEIQAFVVDNDNFELSFKTLDTLLPIIKNLIENYSFDLFLAFSDKRITGTAKNQHLTVKSIVEPIIQMWEERGFIEKAIIDRVITLYDENTLYPGCYLKVFSKLNLNDFKFKVMSQSQNDYDKMLCNASYENESVEFSNVRGLTRLLIVNRFVPDWEKKMRNL